MRVGTIPSSTTRAFWLSLPARYVVARCPLVRGSGRVVVIRRNEIILGVEHALTPGEWVQMAIPWPARKDDRYALELNVGGEVTRASDIAAVIRIEDYDLMEVLG